MSVKFVAVAGLALDTDVPAPAANAPPAIPNATANATARATFPPPFPRPRHNSDAATQAPRASLQTDLKTLFMLNTCKELCGMCLTRNELKK
jgi:hypothetical protein